MLPWRDSCSCDGDAEHNGWPTSAVFGSSLDAETVEYDKFECCEVYEDFFFVDRETWDVQYLNIVLIHI